MIKKQIIIIIIIIIFIVMILFVTFVRVKRTCYLSRQPSKLTFVIEK